MDFPTHPSKGIAVLLGAVTVPYIETSRDRRRFIRREAFHQACGYCLASKSTPDHSSNYPNLSGRPRHAFGTGGGCRQAPPLGLAQLSEPAGELRHILTAYPEGDRHLTSRHPLQGRLLTSGARRIRLTMPSFDATAAAVRHLCRDLVRPPPVGPQAWADPARSRGRCGAGSASAANPPYGWSQPDGAPAARATQPCSVRARASVTT